MNQHIAPKHANPAPVGHPERPRRSRRWPVLLMFAFILFVFALKIANYAVPEAIRLPNAAAWLAARYDSVVAWYSDQPQLHSCPAGQRLAVVPGGYVCTTGSGNSPAERLFNTLPLPCGPLMRLSRRSSSVWVDTFLRAVWTRF
jgi:hypothetical protein